MISNLIAFICLLNNFFTYFVKKITNVITNAEAVTAERFGGKV